MSKYHVTLVAELSARGEHEAVAAIEQEESLVEQKQREIDELVAQVGVMQAALTEIRDDYGLEHSHPCGPQQYNSIGAIANTAFSLTPSSALREVKARTLEEAADNWAGFIQVESGDETATQLREMAAAIRKGE